MAKIRVGLSGWDYDGWQGDFYPDDLPRTRRLEYVAERFDTVEVNGTFYSLLKASTYRKWDDATTHRFCFALKGSRFITHSKKLRGVESALANFLASGPLALGRKLGPILWQLPASHRFDRSRLETFVDLLPATTDEAAILARRHDDRVPEPFVESSANHRLRHVLEVRHASYFTAEAVTVLRESGVALAVSHAGEWEMREELTAGFVYLRLHGAPRTYHSGYDPPELFKWAERLRVWREGAEPDDARRITDRRPPPRKGRDAYLYFDNDAEGRAPTDARKLKALVESGE